MISTASSMSLPTRAKRSALRAMAFSGPTAE
jgi:hypothetical protein